MKIVLVAADVGPSNSLQLVANELLAQGHKVVTFFGKGQPFPADTDLFIGKAIAVDADRVLIGLSSTEPRSYMEILAASTAFDNNIPYGFFAATYGEFRRAWFRGSLRHADFLFVLNDGEVEGANKFAPIARVIPSGNPDWATYFTPISTRDSVRQRLGVKAGEKLILVAGSKEVVRNILLWSNTVLAANGLDVPLHIVLARHPGEHNIADEASTEHLYGDILRYSRHPVQFLGGMSSNEALTGSDLVVSSMSTIGITAACQGIPVIDFITEFDEAWWQKLSGQTLWLPAEQGASAKITRTTPTREFYITMNNLMYAPHPETIAMKKAQQLAFSLEAVKGAAATIAATLAG